MYWIALEQNTVLYNFLIFLYFIYCNLLYCIVFNLIEICCATLRYNALPCTVLDYIVTHCNLPYCIASYCVAQYSVPSYCATSPCVASYCATSYCVASYCVASYCIASLCVASFHAASYCVVSCCVASHFVASYCVASYCVAWYCTALYCIVFYFIAYYSTLLHCADCNVLYSNVLFIIWQNILHCIEDEFPHVLPSSLHSYFLLRLVISLLLFLAKNSPSLCRILRLSCGSYANFSMRKSGFYLKGHVIREFPFLDLKYCYNHCLLDPLCKSVNVARGGNGLCQLNNASFYDPMDYVSLTKNNSWGYHSTNFSDRLVSIISQLLEFLLNKHKMWTKITLITSRKSWPRNKTPNASLLKLAKSHFSFHHCRYPNSSLHILLALPLKFDTAAT